MEAEVPMSVVGSCPPQYIDKLRKCRIFVKYGVGYDDVDIERFGKLGIPVAQHATLNYGTRRSPTTPSP